MSNEKQEDTKKGYDWNLNEQATTYIILAPTFFGAAIILDMWAIAILGVTFMIIGISLGINGTNKTKEDEETETSASSTHPDNAQEKPSEAPVTLSENKPTENPPSS